MANDFFSLWSGWSSRHERALRGDVVPLGPDPPGCGEHLRGDLRLPAQLLFLENVCISYRPSYSADAGAVFHSRSYLHRRKRDCPYADRIPDVVTFGSAHCDRDRADSGLLSQ